MVSSFLCAVCTASLALGTLQAGSAERESFEETLDFRPGSQFRLENVNGAITIETWDRPSVHIRAEKEARDADRLRDIEIEVRSSDREVSVVTRYSGRKRDRGKVTYEIRLPAQADVAVQTVNGRVVIAGTQGRIEVSTVNGGVDIRDVTGEVRAETTNGSIEASYREARTGEHRFSTTNGSVRLSLPASSGGDLDARTVNGSVQVDFPTTLHRFSRRHFTGRFGEGGGSFKISTVNGSVTLTRS